MRMWMLPPEWLCVNHLIAEHHDLHRYRFVFEQRLPIAKRQWAAVEPRSMQLRHKELVAEIEARGFRHRTPYRQPPVSYLPEEDRDATIDRDASLAALIAECPECRRQFEAAQAAERETC